MKDKMSTEAWLFLSMVTLGSGIGLAIVFNLMFLILVASGGAFWCMGNAVTTDFRPKAIESNLVDGRTKDQWYEILRMLGKEEYEKLSRPALDGLEDSSEGYGAWDIKRLLNDADYAKVMRNWYPEKYCEFCGHTKIGPDGVASATGSCGDIFGPCDGARTAERRRINAIRDKQYDAIVAKKARASITAEGERKKEQDLEYELRRWGMKEQQRQYNSYVTKNDMYSNYKDHGYTTAEMRALGYDPRY